MTEYQKINTIYKRDMANKKRLLEGQWSTPEFEYLQNAEWEFTEKVDGTNIRVTVVRHEDNLDVTYAGRTDKAQIPPDLQFQLHMMFGRSSHPGNRGKVDRLNEIGALMVERDITTMTFYGEGYGPKIQGGEKYADIPKFVLFDVKVGPWWLESDAVGVLAAALDIPLVPVVGFGTLSDAVALVRGDTRRRVVQFDPETNEFHKAYVPEKFLSTWGDFEAEGIVARPTVQLFDRKGERIITKIKVRDFRD